MTHITNDSTGKPVQATTAWIIAIVTLGYMLPWAIGWINLLLGWTLIGWIIALVMACGAHQTIAVSPPAR
jgi:hypothetical protein